jgi:hypothetical protein
MCRSHERKSGGLYWLRRSDYRSGLIEESFGGRSRGLVRLETSVGGIVTVGRIAQRDLAPMRVRSGSLKIMRPDGSLVNPPKYAKNDTHLF